MGLGVYFLVTTRPFGLIRVWESNFEKLQRVTRTYFSCQEFYRRLWYITVRNRLDRTVGVDLFRGEGLKRGPEPRKKDKELTHDTKDGHEITRVRSHLVERTGEVHSRTSR